MDKLDTPIWQLTPRELFTMQAQWMKDFQKVQEPKPEKVWVTVDEASKKLGRAKSTLYKYMAEWLTQGAVSKVGGVTLINLDKIITQSASKPKITKRNYKH